GGDLNYVGVGTLSLTGANTFTGQTVIQAGTLRADSFASVGTAQPLGKNAIPLVIGTATPQATTGATFFYGGIANLTTNIPIALGSGGGAIKVNSGIATLTLSGVISGGSLTTQGSGTLVLSGANTYTGATTIASNVLVTGTLQTSSVTVSSAGTFTAS